MYLATVIAPTVAPILTYSFIIGGILTIVMIFIKAYKNFVIGEKPIEIVELGRETIRRGSTIIINSSHKLLTCQGNSYQPLDQSNPPSPYMSDEKQQEFKFLPPELSKSLEKYKGLSQSLNELKGKKNDFVRSSFVETETESLIGSDNSFIQSELRRCSVLHLPDEYY